MRKTINRTFEIICFIGVETVILWSVLAFGLWFVGSVIDPGYHTLLGSYKHILKIFSQFSLW